MPPAELSLMRLADPPLADPFTEQPVAGVSDTFKTQFLSVGLCLCVLTCYMAQGSCLLSTAKMILLLENVLLLSCKEEPFTKERRQILGYCYPSKGGISSLWVPSGLEHSKMCTGASV